MDLSTMPAMQAAMAATRTDAPVAPMRKDDSVRHPLSEEDRLRARRACVALEGSSDERIKALWRKAFEIDHEGENVSVPVGKAEAKAADLRKADPTLSRADALAQVYRTDPAFAGSR